MSAARSQMTMRATIERSPAQPADDWGQDGVPQFAEVATNVPCRVWGSARREVDSADKSAVVEDLRGLFPKGADVREDDRLSTVTDRQGVELYAGPIAVETIVRRGGSASTTDHVEAMLRRHV